MLLSSLWGAALEDSLQQCCKHSLRVRSHAGWTHLPVNSRLAHRQTRSDRRRSQVRIHQLHDCASVIQLERV